MKPVLFILLLFFSVSRSLAQADSVQHPPPVETTRQKPADTQVLQRKVAVRLVPETLNRQPAGPLLLQPPVDSTGKTDSLKQDTLRAVAVVVPQLPEKDSTSYARYMNHPYLPMHKAAISMIIDYREKKPKDELFYLLCGLVFFFAFLKVAFPRYCKNLFNAFFQSSLRLKQTKEQLLQDKLASLLTNLLFVATGSLYAALVIRYEQWAMVSFWQLVLYGALLLVVVYLVKYIFLLFSGWVFNSSEQAAGYVFIVFLVNKAIGILLIPFAMIVAFAPKNLADVGLTVSGGVVVALFLYRYIVSFTAIRNNLKVNALHFFLYLCAVEILPLLVIYKVLINYIDGRF